MTIPYPQATTRADARDNAIRLALAAEDHQVQGQIRPAECSAMIAEVWSHIAATFPEEERVLYALDDAAMVEEDHRPYPAQDVTEVIPRVVVNGDAVTVPRETWNVLRALAMRYVWSSLEHRADVDLSDMTFQQWDFHFTYAEGNRVEVTTVHT